MTHPSKSWGYAPEPKRTVLVYYNGDRAWITVADGYGIEEIETCRIWPDRYIKIDDGNQYPQLCKGASRRGATLLAALKAEEIATQLAAECGGRLYKTEAGYERAKARLSQ